MEDRLAIPDEKEDIRNSEEIRKIELDIVSASSSDSENQKAKKRKVLDEDDYTSLLGSIIERDFFPDVQAMRLDLEYQDAIEKNDYERIERLAKEKLERRLKEREEFGETPRHFDTVVRNPLEIDAESENLAENKRQSDEKLSLNKFLNKYTSEDNVAFEKIQEKTMKKHIERMEFLNSNALGHNEKIENALQLPEMEAQQAIKYGQNDQESSKPLITWKHSIHNSVMFNPKDVPLTSEEAEQHKSRQVILHKNTRFKTNPFHSVRAATVAQTPGVGGNPLKSGKIGVDGKEINASATPNIGGFKFVPSTPCLRPESLPGSPLMTWGVIEATPITLRGDVTPLLGSGSSHFTIPEIPEKEVLGQELANRILSRKKHCEHSVSQSGTTNKGVRSSNMERLNSMSPAARLFATKKLGVHQSLDRSLQASYSPLMSTVRTPTPRRIVTPSPAFNRVVTPSSSKVTQNVECSPKRSRAAEFF